MKGEAADASLETIADARWGVVRSSSPGLLRKPEGEGLIVVLRVLEGWEISWHDVKQGAWPTNMPANGERAYTLKEIRHWLAHFLRRFFTNQFKRSALPNGPKISSGGSLSPRGDWRAPSDGSPDVWLAELAQNVPER